MAIEVGKNRLEALGEVEETADLIRYYAQTVEDNDGFDHPMDNLGDAAVHTRSILRPHGVFAVISPFNFPMALAAGPSAAALDGRQHGRLQAGLRRAADRRSSSTEALRDAGVPTASFNIVMGPGDTVGAELQENPGIDGIVFTGSYEVGLRAVQDFSTRYPRPCIVEMGGKNPAIVMRARRPRGGGRGRSCARRSGSAARSARRTSRVYVERPVHDELVRLLVEKTEEITIGDPIEARELARARSSTRRRSTGTSRRSPRRAATARCSPAASA